MSRKPPAPTKSNPGRVEEISGVSSPGAPETWDILDGLSDACLVAGADGKLCYANDAARDLFHLKGRVTGRKLSLVLSDRKALDLFEEAVHAGRPRARSLTLTLSGGGSCTCLLSIVPVTVPGGTMLMRIALRRLAVPAEPPAPEGAAPRQEALQKLGDPLTIIQGYLENLLDGVIRDPVVMRQCLAAMQRQALQIQRLLGALSN